ncbi:hypothetical protein N0V94_006513 [Neodidymelliopsis sp. IMI 364377]|nr:hypothetical protein N0V94_006513 [Neodidymelliopsis sp. IMI 364377]
MATSVAKNTIDSDGLQQVSASLPQSENSAVQIEAAGPKADGEGNELPSTDAGLATLLQEIKALHLKVAELERNIQSEADKDTEDELPEFNARSYDEFDNPKPDLWNKWRARRQVAKEILRKVERLRKLKHKGTSDRTTDYDFSEEEDSDASPRPPRRLYRDRSDPIRGASSLTPELNLVRWVDFERKRLPCKSKVESRFVIDILIGKPIVTWDRTFRSLGRDTQTITAQSATSNVTGMIAANPEDTPLPDRIRVNSRLLLAVFAKLHRVSVFDMFRDVDFAVFLRPFKMLIFFQKELKDRFNQLVARYGDPESTKTSDFDTSTPETEMPSDPMSKQVTPNITGNDKETYAIEEGALESALALEHMRPLMEFFDHHIVPRQSYLASTQCRKVTFHDMWLLFKPGEVVIESDGNQAYRIVKNASRPHRAIPPWQNFEEKGPQVISPPINAQPLPLPPPPMHTSELDGDDKPFKVWCVYIGSDGFNIGPVTRIVQINSFEGEKIVTDLPVYPLRFRKTSISGIPRLNDAVDTTSQPIQDQLIERGKRFLEMNSIQHAHYAGPIYKSRDLLEGQVVIDNSQVFVMDETRVRPKLSRWMSPISPPPPWDGRSSSCNATCCHGDVVWGDDLFDARCSFEYLDGLWLLNRGDTPSIAAVERPLAAAVKDHISNRITDDEYLIMSDMVYGFVLRTRKWAQLNLAHISDVSYNSDIFASTADQSSKKASKTAFDDLVLPPGHKEVILSLVAQHFRDEEHHEVDIFQGKGKGLILLLHGAPGVGKTSTAEGVAQAFKKPLLQITCGDLGFTAKEVEEALERNFELASRWDCVLLLDEADVFLASRSSGGGADLNRNALVAVFLRVLEYYTGILFLTTNRIGDFDEAFASRIHVSLEYPQLSRNSTEKILALNMRLIKERFRKNRRLIDIEETEICSKFLDFWQDNEEARLNGRQIRNACQTALALAEFEAQGNSHEAVLRPDATVNLQPTHFDTILNAYLDFADYLSKTYGVTPDERAKEQKLRAKKRTARKARAGQPPSMHTGAPAGSFGGAHFYNQHSQQPIPSQQGYQMPGPTQPVYQIPPQNQPYHQGAMQGQQGYQVPGHHLNSPLPGYAVPTLRNEDGHLSVTGLQQPMSQSDDANAGHEATHQGQAYHMGGGPQHLQPQPGARR